MFHDFSINMFLGLCLEYGIGANRDAEKSKKYLKAAELAKIMELGKSEE